MRGKTLTQDKGRGMESTGEQTHYEGTGIRGRQQASAPTTSRKSQEENVADGSSVHGGLWGAAEYITVVSGTRSPDSRGWKVVQSEQSGGENKAFPASLQMM